MLASLHSFPTRLLDSVSSIQHAFYSARENFWRSSSVASSYLDFLLSEIDPLLSQKETRAEIVRIVQETPQSKTFVLRPSHRWVGFEAGQYINVGVCVAGRWLRRNYSLSLAPEQFARTGLISITVKQVEGGAVSNALCQQAKIGDMIQISAAFGNFTLNEAVIGRAVYVAAGSGITPIISMLEAQVLRNPKLSTSLIYDVRGPEDVIFAKRLEQLALNNEHFQCRIHFSATHGYLTQQILKDIVGQNDASEAGHQAVYLCGPDGFMQSAKAYLLALGIQESDIRQEHFGGKSLTPNVGGAAQVVFEKSGKQIESSGDKTLLELAEQAGLQPKFGCRQGICHECSCERGTGAMIHLRTGQAIPDDQAIIQSCMAMPVGEVRLSHW